MIDTTYYVYQYLTEDGIPYYIGKGKNNRINVQHRNTLLPPKERRIKIKENLTNDDAKKIEIELIQKYGRKMDGGILDNIKINQWACYSGWKHSEETILKIKQANLGKIRTEEHKEKYRQPKSQTHKENIRKANLGKLVSDETKQKISNTLMGNTPWNKGVKGIPWSEARRNAHLKSKENKGN